MIQREKQSLITLLQFDASAFRALKTHSLYSCKLHEIDNTGLHKDAVEIAGYRKTTLFVLSFVSLNVKYKSVPGNP